MSGGRRTWLLQDNISIGLLLWVRRDVGGGGEFPAKNMHGDARCACPGLVLCTVLLLVFRLSRLALSAHTIFPTEWVTASVHGCGGPPSTTQSASAFTVFTLRISSIFSTDAPIHKLEKSTCLLHVLNYTANSKTSHNQSRHLPIPISPPSPQQSRQSSSKNTHLLAIPSDCRFLIC